MSITIIVVILIIILAFVIYGYNKRKKGRKDPGGDTGTTTSRAVRKDNPTKKP